MHRHPGPVARQRFEPGGLRDVVEVLLDLKPQNAETEAKLLQLSLMQRDIGNHPLGAPSTGQLVDLIALSF
ncbi:MAG: hypothetical protein M1396_01085 [Chloroflexi bacterium]|nr:hypothetical protein [Chloroflexota bacterium]